jgi:hypothetical protein
MSDIESAALWTMYVPPSGGVAIRSTFDRLRRAFGPTDPIPDGDGTPRVYIGEITYVDYEEAGIPADNTMWPAMHKRESFSFESELRALHQELPTSEERGIDFMQPTVPGVSLAVDLDTLIEAVFVSPAAPEWFAGLVASVCARYDLGAPVTQSTLAGSPIY